MADVKKQTEQKKDDAFRNWTFEFYEESCPTNWRQMLSELKVPLYANWHDKDLKDDSVPDVYKKKHCHVHCKFAGKKSLKQILEIASLFGVNYAQPVRDSKAMDRYLCHLDNPEKAQYSPDDVMAFGGLPPYSSAILTAYEKEESEKEDRKSLLQTILTFEQTDWCDIVEWILENEPEHIDALMKYSYFYSSVVRSKNSKVMRGLTLRQRKRMSDSESLHSMTQIAPCDCDMI